MYKSLVFLIVLTFFFTNSYGQNDWREGFIIQNPGDTVHGFIDYRPNRSNSALCYFRRTEQEEPQVFTPHQISGYRYTNGKYYISKDVPVGEGGTERMFLEFLIDGAANIFYYIREDEHYFLEKNGKLHELKNTHNEVYVDGRRYQKEKKEYVGVLKYYFQDASMQNTINNTEWGRKPFIKIARKYHEKVCEDGETCIVYEKNVKPLKVNFGVTYSTSNRVFLISHRLNGLEYELISESGNYSGIGFNFQNLFGMYYRFSFQLEFLANSIYYKKKDINGNIIEEKNVVLNIPLLLNYRILATKVYPAIQFGVSNTIIRNSDFKMEHLAFNIGLSLNYEFEEGRRFFIQTRYEKFLLDFANDSGSGILRFGGGVFF